MSRNPTAKRAAIHARSGHRCELALEGCTGLAEELHHVVKQEWGGRHALGNLRAACPRCHAWVHRHEDEALALGLIMRPLASPRETTNLPLGPFRAPSQGAMIRDASARCVADHPLWEFVRCTLPAGHAGQHRGIKGVHGGQIPMLWHVGRP